MATDFPDSLDSLINPQGTDSVQTVSHAEQHADANDAIEALQEKVGVDNSTDINSLDYKISQIDPDNFDAAGSAATAQSNAEDYADGLAVNYDPAGSATTALTAANEYTDTAVSSLGNTLPNTYVPLSDVASADGVASLDSDGFIPQEQLDIDSRIQDVSAAVITGGTHTNLTVEYNSTTKKLNFTAESGGGSNVSISSAPPASANTGDLWLDSDNTKLHVYNGTSWLEISGEGGTGGTSGFILSSTVPTVASPGSAWFNTEKAKLYVYYDSYWVEATATGATGPVGPAFVDYKGLWNSETSYFENDGVTYIGSLWRLNVANSTAGNIPSVPNWQLIVQKGDKGDTGELLIGTVETILFGETPTVINSGTTTDGILNFKIPGGRDSTIAVGTVNSVLHGEPLTILNSGNVNDAVLDFEIPAGRAATIAVGTVDDVLHGEPATVVNAGDTSDAVLDFEIPAGRASTLTVGTVTTVVDGEPATVVNSGDTSDAVLDFEIPAGRASTLTVGTVTTVVDGEPATVVNSGDTSDAVFNFEIPAGPRSTITVGTVDDVDFGTAPSVTNIGTATDAIFNFEFTTGRAATIAVGTVDDVDFGIAPAVTNGGTASDAVFNFELTTGRASTLEIGTVTTGSYASEATVENNGTVSDAVFNFSIPQGIPGDFQPGETPPANPLAGQVWYNTTTGRAYVYHDSFWVEFSPGFVGQQGPAGTAGADGADGSDGADGQSWTPIEVSSNITLAKNNRYFVNTSAARTLTLPATPALNDEVQVVDASGNASTYNITVARNGSKINGGTGNLIIDNNGGWYTLLYTGATYGWKVG